MGCKVKFSLMFLLMHAIRCFDTATFCYVPTPLPLVLLIVPRQQSILAVTYVKRVLFLHRPSTWPGFYSEHSELNGGVFFFSKHRTVSVDLFTEVVDIEILVVCYICWR
jgi:hypothetical protein